MPSTPLAVALAGLVPGGGYLALRSYRAFAVVVIAIVGLAALPAIHLFQNIELLNNYRGSFYVAWALRGALFVHGFAMIDAYLRRADPSGAAERQRLALAANVVIPGLGYLVARAYMRAATGVLILCMIFIFARVPNQFLDLIFSLTQLAMGAMAYHQARPKQPAQPQKGDHHVAAQLLAMSLSLVVLAGWGWLVQLRMPSSVLGTLSRDAVKVRPLARGLEISIPPIGLDMQAVGDGWVLQSDSPGALFSANHVAGGNLQVGVDGKIPFVSAENYLLALAKSYGYVGQTPTVTSLKSHPTVDVRFEETVSGTPVRHRLRLVAKQQHVLLVMLRCAENRCAELKADFDGTMASVRLKEE